MKLIFLAAFLVFAGAPPEAGRDAAFEFRGVTSRTTIEEARNAGIVGRCTRLIGQHRGSTHCFMSPSWNAQGVSGYETGGGGIEFNPSGTLEEYSSVIEKGAYATIAQAFTLKYGEPCAVREMTLQNGFGAQFPSIVRVWCFADGELSLHSVSPGNVEKAKFVFRVGRAARPPVVNF